MKAYNKSEVDIVFSGWEEDLKQLSEIEVVSVDVLDKIRAEIKFITDTNGVKHIHRDDVFKIIDRHMKEPRQDLQQAAEKIIEQTNKWFEEREQE